MKTQEIKLHLLEKLMHVNNRALLEKMDAILDQEMVVGYTTDGKPLTKAGYDKRLAEAEKQVAAGQTLTQEELEQQSSKW